MSEIDPQVSGQRDHVDAQLLHGDVRERIRELADASIDSIVTDPPYHLSKTSRGSHAANDSPAHHQARARIGDKGFMGHTWDGGDIAFDVDVWKQALRVLKPGGYLVAFGGTRTFHRMVCAIEDAGFEVRDRLRYECAAETKYGALWESMNDDQRGMLLELLNDRDGAGLGAEVAWQYGNGFPKNKDVGKAIDDHLFQAWLKSRPAEARQLALLKAAASDAAGHAAYAELLARFRREAGVEREVVGKASSRDGYVRDSSLHASPKDQAAIGSWGLSQSPHGLLVTKPASPEAEGWGGWGTALKPSYEPICIARKPLEGTLADNVLTYGTGALNIDASRIPTDDELRGGSGKTWAAMHQHEGRVATVVDATATGADANDRGRWPSNTLHDGSDDVLATFATSPAGPRVAGAQPDARDLRHSSARFFYSGKASRRDRNDGLDGVRPLPLLWSDGTQNPGAFQSAGVNRSAANNHPTVKPTELMAYLCKLVTPPGGTILDMYMGSGSTGRGAVQGGFRFIGIDNVLAYVEISRCRIQAISPLLVRVVVTAEAKKQERVAA